MYEPSTSALLFGAACALSPVFGCTVYSYVGQIGFKINQLYIVIDISGRQAGIVVVAIIIWIFSVKLYNFIRILFIIQFSNQKNINAPKMKFYVQTINISICSSLCIVTIWLYSYVSHIGFNVIKRFIYIQLKSKSR